MRPSVSFSTQMLGLLWQKSQGLGHRGLRLAAGAGVGQGAGERDAVGREDHVPRPALLVVHLEREAAVAPREIRDLLVRDIRRLDARDLRLDQPHTRPGFPRSALLGVRLL